MSAYHRNRTNYTYNVVRSLRAQLYGYICVLNIKDTPNKAYHCNRDTSTRTPSAITCTIIHAHVYLTKCKHTRLNTNYKDWKSFVSETFTQNILRSTSSHKLKLLTLLLLDKLTLLTLFLLEIFGNQCAEISTY